MSRLKRPLEHPYAPTASIVEFKRRSENQCDFSATYAPLFRVAPSTNLEPTGDSAQALRVLGHRLLRSRIPFPWRGRDQEVDRTSLQAGGIRFGVWVNVTLKGFRMKSIDFTNAGMITDVPRPLSGAHIAVRNVFVPYKFVRGDGRASVTVPSAATGPKSMSDTGAVVPGSDATSNKASERRTQSLELILDASHPATK